MLLLLPGAGAVADPHSGPNDGDGNIRNNNDCAFVNPGVSDTKVCIPYTINCCLSCPQCKRRDQMTAAFELEKSGPAKSYSHPFLTSPIFPCVLRNNCYWFSFNLADSLHTLHFKSSFCV